jgi:5'(3')-deoxyribonucleotidase
VSHLPILFLDMDGVLADFAGAINAIDPAVNVGAVNDGSAAWDRERKRVMSICIDNPRIFLTLPALPGAIDAVYELMKTWDVHFASTPMQAVHASYGDKALWLDMHLGDGAHKRLVLTHRKDMLRGDVLVDDRTVNGAGQFRGFFIKHQNWPATMESLATLHKSRKWWPSCP